MSTVLVDITGEYGVLNRPLRRGGATSALAPPPPPPPPTQQAPEVHFFVDQWFKTK